MKIGFVGDIHFGIKQGDKTFLSRQIQFVKEQLIPTLKKNLVKDIIFFGDIFDTREKIKVDVMNEVIDLFEKDLKDFKCHIILGNHDIFYKTTVDVHSIRCLESLKNVKVYDRPTSMNMGGLNFLMLPWVCDYSELESQLKGMLVNEDFEKYDICCSHLDICGFSMGNGKNNLAVEGTDPNMLGNYIDTVFSGHFHSISSKNVGNCTINYIGSAMQFTWGDSGCERGFWVFDTEDENNIKFHENIHQIKFNKINFPEQFSEEQIKGNYIDVIYKEEECQSTLKLIAYLDQIAAYGPVGKVKSTMIPMKKIDLESEIQLENLSLLELIKAYVDDKYPERNDIYNELVSLYNEFKQGGI